MKEIIVWLIHTPAGTIGLVAATAALFTKKGAALHRKSGTFFTISMLMGTSIYRATDMTKPRGILAAEALRE